MPRQIYLSDNEVTANIDIGLDGIDIDLVTVVHIAILSNLHSFVVNEHPQQYQTVVLERGVHLLTGQRQRIGNIGVLYHYPQVLILTEANSALDKLS